MNQQEFNDFLTRGANKGLTTIKRLVPTKSEKDAMANRIYENDHDGFTKSLEYVFRYLYSGDFTFDYEKRRFLRIHLAGLKHYLKKEYNADFKRGLKKTDFSKVPNAEIVNNGALKLWLVGKALHDYKIVC